MSRAPVLALPMLLLALAGCDVRERLDAAEGVRDFVAAAQSGDRAAFEARIDRPRLRESLKARLRDPASGVPPHVLSRLDTPQGEQMIDAMIAPEAFRLSFNRMGVVPEKSPTAVEIGAAIRMQGPDRACIPEGPTSDRCVMTFARQGEVWKLVAVAPTQMKVERTAARPAG